MSLGISLTHIYSRVIYSRVNNYWNKSSNVMVDCKNCLYGG